MNADCTHTTFTLVQVLWCNILPIHSSTRHIFSSPIMKCFKRKWSKVFFHIVVISHILYWTMWTYSSFPRWNSPYESECAKLLWFNGKWLIWKWMIYIYIYIIRDYFLIRRISNFIKYILFLPILFRQSILWVDIIQ